MTGFSPGDKVWPREGVMVLQHAPQVVIGTYSHPVAGDWLWLDDGQCGFRSYVAAHWTTDEPGEAEVAARAERVQQRIAENAARYPAFLNPCPVCGADDEHAERMKDTLAAAAKYPVATICPHPAQPGHGTGCCCAGRSRPARANLPPIPPEPYRAEVFPDEGNTGCYRPAGDAEP